MNKHHIPQHTINKDEELLRELREDGSKKALKKAQKILEKDPQAVDQLIADESEAYDVAGLERGESVGEGDLGLLPGATESPEVM